LLVLLALVFVCYRPQLPGNFIWDDRLVLQELNPLINGELTPWTIWFQTDFVLANFGFWAEWLAWGEHPLDYHVVNLVLHGLSAWLLWRLLVRLRIPGAWFAAAVFAVHPVCVNSVARIAELKNTLSLVFFLLAFWLYLRGEEAGRGEAGPVRPSGPGWWSHEFGWCLAAWLAFLLGLFSKTTIITLPVLLLLCAWWQRGRLTRADGVRTAPFFGVAVVFGLMSAWFQQHQALAGAVLAPMGGGDRLAVAGHDVWIYAGKVLWPAGLSVVYPWWQPMRGPGGWLPPAGVAGVLLAGWIWRRTWGRHLLFGFGAFTVALFPALGFFDAQFQTWFQVSDHLQYLPMIGLVALAAAALASHLSRTVYVPVAAGVVVVLVSLSCQRARVFAGNETLWRDTLAKNPGAWMARNNLGVILAKQNHWPEAREQFEASLAELPGNPVAEVDLGTLLAAQGDLAGARDHFQAALAKQPVNGEARAGLAQVLARLGEARSARTQYEVALQLESRTGTRLQFAAFLYQTGDYAESARQYQRALAADLEQVEPLNNLAWLLATCPEGEVRNGAAAVRYAEKACALTRYTQAGPVGTLAAAYAEAGRFGEAVKMAEAAVRLAEMSGNERFAGINRQLLRLYQAGRPYHEVSVGAKPAA
jgi:Tfp pilus assembly protein PilF